MYMRPCPIIAAIACIFLSAPAFAQNPYESIGKDVKVLTLSDGKFNEFHPNDTLRRVGSVIVNLRTKEIYQFIEQDTLYSEATLDPTIISRWYSLDPLMAKFPSISPYAFAGNNPIFYVDPDGRAFVDFDEAGNVIGVKKNNWWHNLWHGRKGRILNADGTVQRKFRFADPKQDVADIEAGVITKIVVVEESQIKEMLVNAGAFNEANRQKPAEYLLQEGPAGGKFDFSYTAIPDMFPGASYYPLDNPSPMIFLVDNVAHNHMNFGNFLFGAGGATLGVSLGALRTGAHYRALTQNGEDGYDPQFDSSDDQYSIKKGYHYARGGGLLGRLLGTNPRAWDKAKLKGSVEVGPIEMEFEGAEENQNQR